MIQATPEHCWACFATLSSHLRGVREAPVRVDDDGNVHVGGLFVTWSNTKDGSLRGCIGSLSEVELGPGLRDYAVRAATRDSRFTPITSGELPGLTCGVSLLGGFEEGLRWDEWTVGVHGIIIRLDLDGKRFSATYLPEVAPEQGWTMKQAIASLLAKAGVDKRRISESLFESIVLTRYRSSKAKCSYEEWRKGANMS